ncbi:MAG: glycine cleavage system protein GcvH [Chloroflexota bacterium]|jgi:glycine cleavage system H protein|nr:glycine cleavage system protein H [Chloroflexota bacterium]MQF83812.1 glycine cleavage system protein GcvH [SAR202 cluster bacterium]GIS30300.1 MAG: glycine cleavage system H protein [Dehalococcoidia bacterium]MAQ48296.1 glycine cleavage system protein H [Chloroflexota bacterium]MBS17599.1 glycine cleavage system protein H [Chloroflexota bacterium]|tara:strand:- start:332 stop:709 length:378 start_codon:yes stop_codon:yes gene_type:complete
MSAVPENLKYSEDHEWVKIEDNVAIIGITMHAAESLGDIVYIDVDSLGKDLKQFEKFGEIESVKAVSDLFVPVSGKVVEINEELTNNPEYVNEDCYEKGWIIKLEVENSNDLEKLLGSSDYEKII